MGWKAITLGPLEAGRGINHLAVVVLVEFLQPLGHRVLEAGKVSEPFKLNFAHGTVALLGDDELCLALMLLAVLAALVVFLAMYEQHDVGVLLNCARFTEVRQTWDVVF